MNKDFMSYALIYAVSNIVYNVFFSNASIVFVDHLGLSREDFGYYQSINTFVYIISSFLGVKLIMKKSLYFTKNLGLIIFIIGCSLMFITSIINDTDIEAILAVTLVTAAGVPLIVGLC